MNTEMILALLGRLDTPPDTDEVLLRLVQDRQALLYACRVVVGEFEAIKQRQYELLTLGQSLQSAAANWNEATMGLSVDFEPLMAAIAQAERP